MKSSKDIYLYTDASFSLPHNLAVGGWILFPTRAAHEGIDLPAFKQTLSFEERNNIRAEVRAANQAMVDVEEKRAQEDWGNVQVHLFSDCQTVTELPKRRDKLEGASFSSAKTGDPLANKDLYQEFFRLFDLVTPNVHWVRGHSPRSTHSIEQRNFSYIDKLVRKKLRDVICSRIQLGQYRQ